MKTLDARAVIDSLNKSISFHEEHKLKHDFDFEDVKGNGVLKIYWEFEDSELGLELEVVYRTLNDEDGVGNDIDFIKNIKVLYDDMLKIDFIEIPVDGLNEHNLKKPIERIFDTHNKIKKFWDEGYYINLINEVYHQRGENWVAIGGLK